MRAVRRLAGRALRAWQNIEFAAWRVGNGRHRERPVTVYGCHRLFIKVDDFRGYRIWRLGGTQKEKVGIVATLCRTKLARFVDVGANYGEFSLAPASVGVSCLVVEPNPELAACLRKTFAGFGNVTVLEAAASNRSGNVSFHFCARASGSGSLAEGIPHGEAERFGEPTRATTVRAVTLDELHRGLPAVPGGLVLKIDVEGFEREVLEGARDCLARVEWWRALVEFSPACLRAAGKDADSEWSFFRRYPGRLMPVADAQALTTLGELPEQTPGEVDIVIGRGRIPEAADRLVAA